jgi:hypothetical protein
MTTEMRTSLKTYRIVPPYDRLKHYIHLSLLIARRDVESDSLLNANLLSPLQPDEPFIRRPPHWRKLTAVRQPANEWTMNFCVAGK